MICIYPYIYTCCIHLCGIVFHACGCLLDVSAEGLEGIKLLLAERVRLVLERAVGLAQEACGQLEIRSDISYIFGI